MLLFVLSYQSGTKISHFASHPALKFPVNSILFCFQVIWFASICVTSKIPFDGYFLNFVLSAVIPEVASERISPQAFGGSYDLFHFLGMLYSMNL